MRIAILLITSFALIGKAFGLEPIDTDGPDFVESSEVVPQGYFQYELGLGSSLSSRNSQQARLTDTPLLLRYGIAKDWELRLASDGYINQDGQRGVGNTDIGFKYHSQDRNIETGAPAIAWIVHFQTPIASPYFRTGGVLPSLRSVITWSLANHFALGIMSGLAVQSNDSGQNYTAGIFGAVLNKQVTDKARVFIELSMPTISTPNQNGIITSGDFGAAYLLTNDTQLGFRAGAGLNTNSPRQYILFELAQRF